MRVVQLFIFAFLLHLISCNNSQTNSGNNGNAQWTPLFNGVDLSGWTVKIAGHEPGDNYANTFCVNNGLLCVNYNNYNSFNNKFGALYYNKEFSDFKLRIVYRFVGDTVKGAPSWGFRDSGIQYHCQSPQSVGLNQAFPVCLEYNLHGGNGSDIRPVGEVCGNGISYVVDGVRTHAYSTPAKVARTFHGNGWVTAEIESRNGEFRHFVNGEEIMNFTAPQYKPDHEFAKAFYNESNSDVSKGFISLQSNSHPIEFKSIDIIDYSKE